MLLLKCIKWDLEIKSSIFLYFKNLTMLVLELNQEV